MIGSERISYNQKKSYRVSQCSSDISSPGDYGRQRLQLREKRRERCANSAHFLVNASDDDGKANGAITLNKVIER